MARSATKPTGRTATKKPVRAAKAKAVASAKPAPAPKKKAAAAKKALVSAKTPTRAAAKPIAAPQKKSTIAKAQAKSARAPKRLAKAAQAPVPEVVTVAPPLVVPEVPALAAVRSSGSNRRSVIDEPESVDVLLRFETSEDVAERKLWADIRDRAAYVLVSGALPTHLRPGSVRLLRQMTEISKAPSAIDGSAGAVKLRPSYVQSFRLQEHPLVLQARRYVKEGYHLSVSRGPNERRPFGRVWLYRPVDQTRAYKATIHSSGAVQAGWV